MKGWKVPRSSQDGTALDPPMRVLNIAEVGRARLFGRACRLVAGNGLSIEELHNRLAAAASQPAPVATGTGSRKLKLSTIASQVDDTEFEMASGAGLLACFRRYENIFGRGERPGQGHECSAMDTEARKSSLCRLRDIWTSWSPKFSRK